MCVGDDTLRRRSCAPRLFGAAWHHDHAAAPGQTPTCWGQNLVLLGVIPEPFGPGRARAHLCDAELWVPLKRSCESGQDTLPYETKAGLLDLMMSRQGEHLDEPLERLLVVDSLYAKAPFLQAMRQQEHTHVLGRLASHRVVFETPPPRPPGKRGAPRKYGDKIDWKKQFAEHAQPVELPLYGRRVKARLWAMTGRVCKSPHEVRLVVCQLEGVRKPGLFLCTDPTLEDAEIVELYGARFSIKEAIRDLVCELALGSDRSQNKKVYQMQVALKLVAGMLLEQLVERQPEEVVDKIRDPWRKRQRRLTMGQVRQGLRWECWSGRELFRCDGRAEASGRNSRPRSFKAIS